MNPRSSNVYLNTLCLAAWAPGQSTLKIAKAVLKMYDETSPDERTMISPVNQLYVKLIREVVDGKLNLNNKSEASETLLQYRDDPAFLNNKYSFDELKEMLTPETLPSQTKIKQLFDKVKNNIVWANNTKRIRMMMVANQRAGMVDDAEKQKAMLKAIIDDAAEFSEIYNSQQVDEDEIIPVDEIDMTNAESIKRALAQQHKKRNGSIIKFGLQGFNRMFGKRQGAAYGESVAYAARSHHYKSGLLMDCTRWHCTLNSPPPHPDTIQPVVLFISLENEVSENLMDWYTKLYVNAYKRLPSAMTDEDIVNYVLKEFGKNGFQLIVLRKMGENFGYKEFVDCVEKIEKRGAKVVATYLDYVTLCRRCPEDKNENGPRQIQLMVARFKDFCAHRDMFFCTGLQLETEAARLASSGQTNIVRRYNESHLADCKGIKREVDVLIFLEIENNAKGVPYLTMSICKHRYVHDTPQEDRTVAYRFTDYGIMNDIDGKDMSVKDIYSEDGSEQEEQQISIF